MHNRYREEEKEEIAEKLDNGEEVVEEIIDAEEFNRTNEELETEFKKLNDLYLRTLAEAENFKKRMNEERIRERKYANQSLLEKIITALDVFDKAININTDDAKLKNFLIGFEMINNQLKEIVGNEGVKRINTENKKFDPAFHHAVETMWQEDIEEGIVLEEFQSGYTYKDRVLRPALVKVNKKEEN